MTIRVSRISCLFRWAVFSACAGASPVHALDPLDVPAFRKDIRPLLENYCFDCHADGAEKGKIAFDTFASDEAMFQDHDLWRRVLRNLRAGIMPPPDKARPTAAEADRIAQWIKASVFQIRPDKIDPGHVRVRRLNRVEYRNTIHDLMGVEFDSEGRFPPDDTGFGFDNIGDVLTLPPLLLEKYLSAAHDVVDEAVPLSPGTGGQESRGARRYARWFPREIPSSVEDRRAFAREILGGFARHAFRRPVDPEALTRLVGFAEKIYSQTNRTFQAGIAASMVAVLASPQFLFREEHPQAGGDAKDFPLLDEFSLASRLSYFLWSSMPDDDLLRLAEQGKLRANLSAQVDRMLKDQKAQALVKNFAGQWLRARDVESVPIESRVVLERERKPDPVAQRNRQRLRELNNRSADDLSQAEKDELGALRAAFRARQRTPTVELGPELRHAMRRETECVFEYIFKEDRSLLEFLDSDYTFLNDRLAEHYGIPNVAGPDFRKVQLPPNSPRGGVLTEGTVLIATSNPTRTSPVKRGLFILDNVLGTPPPAPPANVPPLEAVGKNDAGKPVSLREALAIHRANPMCSSCHNRMDPLGLAFEHFNALGLWREAEFEQPIDASGKLITGEDFATVSDLKRILVKNHARDFYRAVTEKMLTYALGRGLEDFDTETVDGIIARIDQAKGRPSALVTGIIESVPFQKCRPSAPAAKTLTEAAAAPVKSSPK